MPKLLNTTKKNLEIEAEIELQACRMQEELESIGHRTPTRHVLRALKKCTPSFGIQAEAGVHLINKESNFKINCINSINLDENCLKTEISEKWI